MTWLAVPMPALALPMSLLPEPKAGLLELRNDLTFLGAGG
jgi:hypothetical protein